MYFAVIVRCVLRLAVGLVLVSAADCFANHQNPPALIGSFYTNDPEGLVMVPNADLQHPVAYNVRIGWVAKGHYRNGYGALTNYQWHLQATQWGRHSGISRMRLVDRARSLAAYSLAADCRHFDGRGPALNRQTRQNCVGVLSGMARI